MIEIPLTQNKVANIDNEDVDLLQYKWCAVNRNGKHWYAVRQEGQRPFRKHLSMHRVILTKVLGHSNFKIVDHINGNGLDNRRCNLRPVTTSQNLRNQKKQNNTTSLFKGVCWDKKGKKWKASIHLGVFDNPINAAKAYDKAALEFFGEHACLNFPKETHVSI